MLSKLNEDFQWHVFFMMIFLLRNGSNIEDFDDFIQFYYRLIIQPAWLKHALTSFNEHDAFTIRNTLETMMAEEVISHHSIHMVYEETMYGLMNVFEAAVSMIEEKYTDKEVFDRDTETIRATLSMRVNEVFAK